MVEALVFPAFIVHDAALILRSVGMVEHGRVIFKQNAMAIVAAFRSGKLLRGLIP